MSFWKTQPLLMSIMMLETDGARCYKQAGYNLASSTLCQNWNPNAECGGKDFNHFSTEMNIMCNVEQPFYPALVSLDHGVPKW